MKLKINDKWLDLNEDDVRLCRDVVNRTITNYQEEAEKKNAPQFYITSLVLMHLISGELLEDLPEEEWSRFLEYLEQKRKRRAESEVSESEREVEGKELPKTQIEISDIE